MSKPLVATVAMVLWPNQELPTKYNRAAPCVIPLANVPDALSQGAVVIANEKDILPFNAPRIVEGDDWD